MYTLITLHTDKYIDSTDTPTTKAVHRMLLAHLHAQTTAVSPIGSSHTPPPSALVFESIDRSSTDTSVSLGSLSTDTEGSDVSYRGISLSPTSSSEPHIHTETDDVPAVSCAVAGTDANPLVDNLLLRAQLQQALQEIDRWKEVVDQQRKTIANLKKQSAREEKRKEKENDAHPEEGGGDPQAQVNSAAGATAVDATDSGATAEVDAAVEESAREAPEPFLAPTQQELDTARHEAVGELVLQAVKKAGD